jgi:cysteine desulfurase / selenocysteine lyase
MTSHKQLYHQFCSQFLGISQSDQVLELDGSERTTRRVYLDTTATSLMPTMVWGGLESYFQLACANSHTQAHRAGRDTTKAIEDSRHAIGKLVGYNPDSDVVLFTSNGATGAINFLARALFPPELRLIIKRFPNQAPQHLIDTLLSVLNENGQQAVHEMLARPLVVTTMMEHHSNLLPWMEAVGHDNMRVIRINPQTGTLDLEHLRSVLKEEGHRVRLVAVTGVSNVTGIINPVETIAKLTHGVGAQLLVDGAQWVPHAAVKLHQDDPSESIDFLVLSGHKLYAPGSRGALVGHLRTFAGRRCVSDVGGGMVDYVTMDDFSLKDQVTAREEAGTPNIPGTIAMGLIAEMLLRIGMDYVATQEHELTHYLLEKLTNIPEVFVYGGTDLASVPRAGVVSFNVQGLNHGLVAAYLNDFHNIALRNACFCAQPYVTALLEVDEQTVLRLRDTMICGDRRQVLGMVRASLGIYSTKQDVDCLVEGLQQLIKQQANIVTRYTSDPLGNYRLTTASDSLSSGFSIQAEVDRWQQSGTETSNDIRE